MIIGVSGKIGSGKDTVGRIIQYIMWCESANSSDLPDFEEWNENFPNIISAELSKVLSGYGGWEIKKFAGKLKQVVALLTGCKVEDLENQEFKDSLLPPEWTFFVHKILNGDQQIARMFPRYESEEAAKEALKKFPWLNCNVIGEGIDNYRGLLQLLGTEAMRGVVHRNVWVNALFTDYKCLSEKRMMIIDQSDGSSNFVSKPFKCEDKFLGQYPNWIITDMRFPNEMKAVKDRNGITIRIEREGLEKSDHPSETALDNELFDYKIHNNGTISHLINEVQAVLENAGIIQIK